MTNLFGIQKLNLEWENLDLDTLYAYIGLLLAAGVYRSYGESIDELWHESRGRPFFRATMSKKRFLTIHRCIRFDRRDDRANRVRTDKFAAIREVFGAWNAVLPKLYTLGKCATVDEQLVPYRGRCAFRQYMPMKPAKYGLKFFLLCDADTRYAYNCIPYTGMLDGVREKNQGQLVVLELCENLSNRNITCDNFFTLFELAKKLKTQRMTLVGTFRKNRKELPPILVDVRRKPIYTTVEAYNHTLPATLVSYVPKKTLCHVTQHLPSQG